MKRFDDVVTASLKRLPVNMHSEIEEATLTLELDNTSRYSYIADAIIIATVVVLVYSLCY